MGYFCYLSANRNHYTREYFDNRPRCVFASLLVYVAVSRRLFFAKMILFCHLRLYVGRSSRFYQSYPKVNSSRRLEDSLAYAALLSSQKMHTFFSYLSLCYQTVLNKFAPSLDMSRFIGVLEVLRCLAALSETSL